MYIYIYICFTFLLSYKYIQYYYFKSVLARFSNRFCFYNLNGTDHLFKNIHSTQKMIIIYIQ